MTYSAGFDIGGTNARLRLYDAHMSSVAEERRRIRDATSPQQVVRTMVQMLHDACSDTVDPQKVEAVGVGLAGQLSVDRRVVLNAPNLDWRDIAFCDLLEGALREHFDLEEAPVLRLVNDLNAQLWGESVSGAVTDHDDVLAVYVGTGIGGAILSEGRLVTGAGGNAGEIGHSKVVVGGRPCGCGESGCVEAYAGGIHLEQQIALLAQQTGDAKFKDLVDERGADLGRADDMAISHHDIGDIWEEATDYLAMVVANACTLLNPSALLIGGGVLENCHTFRAMFLQKAIPLVLKVSRDDLHVEQAIMADAGMLGAADLATRSASETS